MKKLMVKASVCLLAVIMLCSMAVIAFAATVEGLGDNNGYRFKGADDVHNINLYKVDGELCYCLHPDRYVPTWVEDPVAEENILIKAILLLGPGGKYYDSSAQSRFGISFYNHGKEYADGVSGWSNDLGIQFGDWENVWIDVAGDYELDVMWVHYLASYVYNGYTFTSDQVPSNIRKVMKAEVNKIENILEDENSTLYLNAAAAVLYTYAGSNSDYQTLGRLASQPDVKEQGRFKIIKKSAQTDITEGNANYSLAGAVYGIYKDKKCMDLVESLTLKADGNTASATSGLIDKGTYYVKEIAAPMGYELSDEVIKNDIRTNQTVELVLEDKPEMPDETIEIQKISDVMNADMSGAIFRIDYYDTEETQKPMKTWNIQTCFDEEKGGYYAVLSEELPFGIYRIEEIKSPVGFSLKGRTIEFKDDPESRVIEGAITLVLRPDVRASFDHSAQIIAYDKQVDMLTEAMSQDDGSHILTAGRAAIVDNVIIYNLDNFYPSYCLKGSLLDSETGEALTDENGDELTDSCNVKPEEGDETYAKTIFEFDATEMAGKSITVKEELYGVNEDGEEVLICIHDDLANESQKIMIIEPEPEPEPETTTEAKPEPESEPEITTEVESEPETETVPETTPLEIPETVPETTEVHKEKPPQTGDDSFVYCPLAGTSAAALILLLFLSRKKRKS